ncbi:Uu.00g111300.m01.CDS01 [Anthostomella pinea]|uniref:Uu.00g111300.m01.CDS01 n=1 Tax=Anthostomella pinea TaxID=933095 RepID=A0AAI8YGH3_9PEZI|nr:Uu.00g111300.m01.CDS01 [Anthostomella pinea]
MFPRLTLPLGQVERGDQPPLEADQQDRFSSNRLRDGSSSALVAKAACQDNGESRETWWTVYSYAKRFRPSIVLLENAKGLYLRKHLSEAPDTPAVLLVHEGFQTDDSQRPLADQRRVGDRWATRDARDRSGNP